MKLGADFYSPSQRHLKSGVCIAALLALSVMTPVKRAEATATHLYYCEPSNAYFPYVKFCPVPWQQVDTKPAATVQPASLPEPIPVTPPAVVPPPVVSPPAVSLPVVPPPVVAETPVAITGGKIVIAFTTEQPVVVCAPLQVCDVTLQAGERVNSMLLGDKTGWTVDTATEGAGTHEIQHLIVRPLDVGPDTSVVVTTTVRTYHLRLQSHRTNYMAQVAFSYPEEVAQETHADEARQEPAKPIVAQKSEDQNPPSTAAVVARADWTSGYVGGQDVGQTMAQFSSADEMADDDGFVLVKGIKYVKGREPRPLDHKSAEEASDGGDGDSQKLEMVTQDDPKARSSVLRQQPEPPLPQAAPRPWASIER